MACAKNHQNPRWGLARSGFEMLFLTHSCPKNGIWTIETCNLCVVLPQDWLVGNTISYSNHITRYQKIAHLGGVQGTSACFLARSAPTAPQLPTYQDFLACRYLLGQLLTTCVDWVGFGGNRKKTAGCGVANPATQAHIAL